MKWLSCPQGVDPFTGHPACIEDRKLRSVVLEAFSRLGTPDRDEVIYLVGLDAGDRETPKNHIPTFMALRKNEERWNFHPLVW